MKHLAILLQLEDSVAFSLTDALLCVLQTLVVLFSIDDLTGFEITKLVELPEPFGIFVVWGFVLPLTYIVSSSLTNLVLKDFLILKVG